MFPRCVVYYVSRQNIKTKPLSRVCRWQDKLNLEIYQDSIFCKKNCFFQFEKWWHIYNTVSVFQTKMFFLFASRHHIVFKIVVLDFWQDIKSIAVFYQKLRDVHWIPPEKKNSKLTFRQHYHNVAAFFLRYRRHYRRVWAAKGKYSIQ